jgi:hypothetical protein
MSPQQQQQYMAQWQYYQQLQREREMLAQQQAGQSSDPQAQQQYQQWLQQQAAQVGSQQPGSPQHQDAYHEWLQQQIAQQQAQNQQSQPTGQPAPQVQSNPSAYQQHLEEIEQQAGQDQPTFSQPWLSPEQQAAKQAEIQGQEDYQPQQLAQYPAEQPQQLQPQPQSQPQIQAQPMQEIIPQPQTVPQAQQPQVESRVTEAAPIVPPAPSAEIGPHATVDHSHDGELQTQNAWKLTQTIGNGSEDPESAPKPQKKSHKKLTVFMSTLIFAAVGTAVVVVFSMISQVGAKTLSCNNNGQNNKVADLVSYELKLSVKLTGEKFSDITTNASLMFNNSVDAQNYVNGGGNGRVSTTMIPDDKEYIKSTSGAVIEENKVNYSVIYKSDYIGSLGGVDISTYNGTAAQLISSVQKNLENIGYTCSYK